MGEKGKIRLTGLVTGFVNGLFGSGGGTLVVPAMERFLHVETHKAHATAIAVILPLSVLSLLIYFWQGEMAWQVALWASGGGIIGRTLPLLIAGDIIPKRQRRPQIPLLVKEVLFCSD